MISLKSLIYKGLRFFAFSITKIIIMLDTYKIGQSFRINYKEVFFLFFSLVLITNNLFFEIYRMAVFDAMPHDDYGYYLLYLIGDEGAGTTVPVPASHAYRFLAVWMAVPFYDLLPFFTFTGASPELSENYLKSLLSLSFITYLSIVLTCIYSYLIARYRFGTSQMVALITLLFTYLMCQHLREGLYGVDAMGVLMMTLTVYYMPNKYLYFALLLIGIFVNEKVAMVFFMLMVGRFVFYSEYRSKKYALYLIAPTLALLLYALVNIYFRLPGNEAHRDYHFFLEQFMTTLMFSLTLKGFILNIIPVLLLIGFYLLANISAKQVTSSIYFKPSDILPLLGLVFITHLVNVDYNAGRIVMYVFPLYVPLATMAIYKILSKNSVMKISNA